MSVYSQQLISSLQQDVTNAQNALQNGSLTAAISDVNVVKTVSHIAVAFTAIILAISVID